MNIEMSWRVTAFADETSGAMENDLGRKEKREGRAGQKEGKVEGREEGGKEGRGREGGRRRQQERLSISKGQS